MNWLTYVTHAGQQKLPAGMEPITPVMVQAAETQIARLGSVANTCVPVPTDPVSPANGGGGVPVTPPSGVVSRYGSAAVARVAPAGSTVAVDAQLASVQAQMPDFVRRSAGGNAIAILGLVGVLGLLTISAMATSGRLSLDRIRRRGSSS